MNNLTPKREEVKPLTHEDAAKAIEIMKGMNKTALRPTLLDAARAALGRLEDLKADEGIDSPYTLGMLREAIAAHLSALSQVPTSSEGM